MNILRKRLTALYTLTTGGILLLVIGTFLISSVKKAKTTQLEQFQVVWSSLSSRLQSANAFSHGFLAQTEADYHMIIHIQENGIPFFYQGSWLPDTERDILIKQAIELAQSQGVSMSLAPVSSTSNTTSLMTMEGRHNDHYYVMVETLSTKGGVKSICAISYIPPVRELLRGTVVYLILLAVLGIGCLWLISWIFVGWSLIPVEESRKTQAQFIAAASHELRSPLAVLRSAVSAISDSPQKKDTLLPLIDSECVRMSRLIDDMLLLASADAKTWKLERKEVDMDTLLIDLLESVQPACREKGISLHLELPSEALPHVWGDPDRIRQIFMVLLDNARYYTPSGSSIFLQAQVDKKKHFLYFQVEDEGCGISQENKPYVFDRFYQADSARSDKQHFGLGLSIAKELVLLHHGTITLSDTPKGGCCFTVTLPTYSPGNFIPPVRS